MGKITQKHKRGFTLIELLVVISIIGLLSSVILAALNQSKTNTQITTRIASAKQLQTALELYYSDHNLYPSTCDSAATSCSTNSTGSTNISYFSACGVGTDVDASSWIPNVITEKFIKSLPTDPNANSSNGVCCYAYKSNGTDYKLIFGYQCNAVKSENNNRPGGVINDATYLSYPSLIDPRRDGGSDSCAQDNTTGINIQSWAIYTSTACQW